MNISDWSAYIDWSIDAAIRHQSWISESVLKIPGFSRGEQRRLISNLCHINIPNPVYLECGCFHGGTAMAAISNSPKLTAFLIEDYSQPFGEEGVRQNLLNNIEEYRRGCKYVELIESDCFDVDLARITMWGDITMLGDMTRKPTRVPVSIFNYDAIHDQWAQRKAWSYFVDALDDIAIVCVDDFSWLPVATGTREGIQDVADKLKVVREWILSDGQPDGKRWNNDQAIFLVEKL